MALKTFTIEAEVVVSTHGELSEIQEWAFNDGEWQKSLITWFIEAANEYYWEQWQEDHYEEEEPEDDEHLPHWIRNMARMSVIFPSAPFAVEEVPG